MNIGSGTSVLLVVMGEVQHVIREILAMSEQLFVSAKATVKRVAAGIDDLRIGKYEMCEAHEREVVWQLIGKKRLVG